MEALRRSKTGFQPIVFSPVRKLSGILCLVMDAFRRERVLRQHLETDRLLGVDVVPAGRLVPDVDAALPQQNKTTAGLTEAGSLFGASASPPTATLDRHTKLQRLTAMDQDEVKPCTKCQLCRGRTQTVFGEGDVDAPLMFIGEGPGQSEDEQGRPFVGRAGELLDKQIVAMGFQRQQVYIANIVKCRPPKNRTPTGDEVEACAKYLRRQIMAIRPRVIVALGGPAMKFLLNTPKGITALRGIWHQYEGLLPDGPAIPVMSTFHPAFLLRQYTLDNRKKVWSDLQAAMTYLAE